ncbi:ubiquitin-like protein ISG15 [Sorex araneus]|uniref:ubiquitin-like protein ISG15 n=1 Tax=Sorex araneus TaxID=42254 RepID=UPI002433A811|nr:ubiquitin-like protein ISG15 [Sorex araneus]XP_054995652.1 ubiquitin-like protein ISG15 [Sorex araneus]XP_054995653.1 ubiquitin-like protein ISG15 [Sorex araneus]XP_054995654.1 ubiquitin-like protein ISG15 [Sorex araneus]XP_054995655.1 ubiquitin-like protein ISG15 [Sorex araneus]
MGFVKVKKLSGEEYTVPLADTLGELQRLVERQTGVPAFLQRLALHPEGTVLQDGQSLAGQGLRPNAVVLLVVENNVARNILVRNTQGQSVSYDVQLTQTVAELKQQVCEKERVRADQFWLGFQGRQMVDTELLGNYGLTNLCTVDMNLYLRGGAGGVA